MTTMSQKFYKSLSTKPEVLILDTIQLEVRAAGGAMLSTMGISKQR